MKVIKLDRRWLQYKKYGHTAAIKFDGWHPDALPVEKILKEITACGGIFRTDPWYGYYGKSNRLSARRPYFITVKDEVVLTMALLKLGTQE